MKLLLTSLILIFTFGFIYCQNRTLPTDKFEFHSSGQSDNLNNVKYVTIHNPNAPEGTIPFPVNYCDYITDGNNMRRLIVLGDTIIVATDINPDRSGPPPVTTSTRVFYNVSYNAGSYWLMDAINTSPTVSTKWANVFPIFNYGIRAAIFCGREYFNNSILYQRGLVSAEVFLSLGSLTRYLTPSAYWRDFFGSYKNSSSIGGLISSPANSIVSTDTLWYMDFDYNTGAFGTARKIADNIDVNFRYNCDIASNGLNIVAVRWKSTNLLYPQAYYIHESTDGGSTWSSGTMVGNANLVNGDSCVAWSSFDVIYKPGTTQKCLAFATVSPSNQITREGSKILSWSPTINSGNPVVICDYHKIWFNDTAQWNRYKNNIQVGMTPLSHPSLAYSDDGTKLYCAFSVIRQDTSTYSTGKNYHYNNIYICTSVNNGATWSSPYPVIGIPIPNSISNKRDYTYPTLAKKGNYSNYAFIVYNESGSPGSFSFFDNAPLDTVYTVFKKILVLTDAQNKIVELLSSFSLKQNYPNPFNPTTNITYNIPKSSFVSLVVYDMLGRKIKTVVYKTQPPGSYEISFDGRELASGIYFYHLKAGDFIETRKMILLK